MDDDEALYHGLPDAASAVRSWLDIEAGTRVSMVVRYSGTWTRGEGSIIAPLPSNNPSEGQWWVLPLAWQRVKPFISESRVMRSRALVNPNQIDTYTLLHLMKGNSMALVAYSDSEGSDIEDAPQPAPVSTSVKPTVSKSQPGKIKVELPSFRAEPEQEDAASPPPAKRAKTSGAFSGFNDLLPAPKRAATQANGLKKGISLKTSSEAAFSRVAPAVSQQERAQTGDDSEYDEFGNRMAGFARSTATEKTVEPSSEVKIVGKATRFRPLSVANNKKKVVKKKAAVASGAEGAEALKSEMSVSRDPEGAVKLEAVAPAAPVVKPKRSLFSVQQDEIEPEEETVDDPNPDTLEPPTQHLQAEPAPPTQQAAANSLDAVAADLNLSAAERRQLFGRKGGKEANVTHFNLDSEYRANEQLRQAGETIDHKAVKAIAPGKHSLQQLVNNARSNQEGIEDKWAEGRRARGEGGSKYGWGK